MRAVHFILYAAICSIPASAANIATLPGIVNFHEVDEHVFRGAQPTSDGLKGLAKLGVKTIVDLTGGSDHSRFEKETVEKLGMQYVHVPLPGLQAPTPEDVWRVLGYLSPSGSDSWPVFIHCKRGKDRTGTVVACYRITHDHWDNQKALEEAKLHGMSRVQRAMQQFILRFQAKTAALVQ